MPTANEQFQSNPVAFLSKNIVRVGYTNTQVRENGGIGSFTLTDYTGFYESLSFHGAKIGMYVLEDGKNANGAMNAYWCRYGHNQFGFSVVWKDAELMFTDTMDGCTFVVGHESKNGARLVGHVNSVSASSKTDKLAQSRDQRRRANAVFGNKRKLFQPEDYLWKPGEKIALNATTFGIRDQNRHWHFYSQLYEFHGGKLVLRAIKKIA